MCSFNMTKKTLSEEDKQLFYEATKDVIPLAPSNKIALTQNKSKTHSLNKRPTFEPDPIHLYHAPQSNIQSQTILSFKHPTLSNKLFKALQNGHFSIDGRLDLHGNTLDCARSKVIAFVLKSLKLDRKMVLIIHGKSSRVNKPIIKQHLDGWLKQMPQVLAYHSATLKHGGTGAIYVLLKKSKKSW